MNIVENERFKLSALSEVEQAGLADYIRRQFEAEEGVRDPFQGRTDTTGIFPERDAIIEGRRRFRRYLHERQKNNFTRPDKECGKSGVCRNELSTLNKARDERYLDDGFEVSIEQGQFTGKIQVWSYPLESEYTGGAIRWKISPAALKFPFKDPEASLRILEIAGLLERVVEPSPTEAKQHGLEVVYSSRVKPNQFGVLTEKDALQTGNIFSPLTQLEKRAMQLDFGLGDGKQRSEEEIAKELDCTTDEVKSLLDIGLKKLRHRQ